MINRLSRKLEEIFGMDLRAIAAFRVALGAILLYDAFSRLVTAGDFLSDSGTLHRSLAAVMSNPWNFSLHMMAGSVFLQGAFLILSAAAAFFLLIGWRTRLVALVCWVLLVSVQVRNPLILNGGDYTLRLFLFWSLFLPLGARGSVDAICRPQEKARSPIVFSAATVAMMVQLVSIYAFTFYLKSKTPEWVDGAAIYYVLNQETLPLNVVLLSHPALLSRLTHAVYYFEFWGPALLFFPVFAVPMRTFAVLGFILMQAGFGVCIRLGFFPWTMSAVMLLFLPSPFWDRLEEAGRGKLNQAAAFGRRGAAWLGRFGSEAAGWRPTRLSGIAVAALAVYVFFWNVAAVVPVFCFPTRISWLGPLLHVDQWWSMYAPPGKQVYWFSIPAELDDGSRIDLYTMDDPEEWKTRRLPHPRFMNRHWICYMNNIAVYQGVYGSHSGSLAAYLVRDWNKHHTGKRRIRKIEVYVISRAIPLPGQPHPEALRQILWTLEWP